MAKGKHKNITYSKWLVFLGIILLGSGLLFSIKINQLSITSEVVNEASQSAKPQTAENDKKEPEKIPTSQSPQNPNGIPILTYHYIGNNPNPDDKARDALEVTPDKFEEQMQYLSTNGFTPISLDTVFAIFNNQAGRPPKAVVLTFDDGYIDFYTNAFPILRRFNFHAVSFIPTGLIGTSYYMNWDQIKEIQSSGLVTFEAHSVTHPNLTTLSEEQILKQLVESKNTLASQTGYPVNFIAYPYGISNGIVQAMAQKAGFLGGLGTWYGKAGGIGMNMPRIKVSGSWSINEFAQRL